MPELPEVEAVRRALDDPVRAFPIERAGPGNGVGLRAKNSLAAVVAFGCSSGGNGSGLSEPGGVGSMGGFSCAAAESAAAPTSVKRRTAVR